MSNYISNNFPIKLLPTFSDQEVRSFFNKGWTYSNIYSLRELRDVFIVLKNVQNKTLKNVFKEVEAKVDSENKEWNERRVLEHLNALLNFNLVRYGYEAISKDIFSDSVINSPISENEKSVFTGIFYSYLRFKEISAWFINPEKEFHSNINDLKIKDFKEVSKPLYFFSNKGRFVDSFLTSEENFDEIFIIDQKRSHLMRFWDVYLKWGITLNQLDRFSLVPLDKKIGIDKFLSMVYFIRPYNPIDLISYINSKYNSREIFIPDLIFQIAKDYQFSVNDIKALIVDEINRNDRLTFERTSEIFIIKGKQSLQKIREATYLYPTINDNYISHIILRR